MLIVPNDTPSGKKLHKLQMDSQNYSQKDNFAQKECPRKIKRLKLNKKL